MNKLFVCVTLFIFSASIIAKGQDFALCHYTIEDGLPGNTVYQVYKDHKGYLWIGTDKGIARYNGVRFEVFTTFDGIADNEVFFFKEDAYGRIWMGTYNGQLCYYQNDSFHIAVNTPFLRLPFKASHIAVMTSEEDSSINVRFNGQLTFLNIGKNYCSVVHALEKNALVDGLNIVSFQKTSSRNYKVIVRDFTFQIDTFLGISNIYPLKMGLFNKITSCQDQNYIINDSEIYTLDLKLIGKIPRSVKKENIYEIYIADSHIFYTTKNGLFIDDTLQVLKDEKVSSIAQDMEGNFWVSTLTNGVYVIKRNFSQTRLNNNCYTGIANYAFADNGRLFFTTSANNLYKSEKGNVKCLLSSENSGIKFISTEEAVFYINRARNYYAFYPNRIVTINDLLSPHVSIHYKSAPDYDIKSAISVGNDFYIKMRSQVNEIDKKYFDYPNVLGRSAVVSAAVTDRIFGMAKAFDGSVWYSTIDKVYRISNKRSDQQKQFGAVSFKNFTFAGQYLIGYTHSNDLLICSNIFGNIKIDTVHSDDCIWDKFYKIDSTHLLISTNNLYRVLSLHSSDAKYSLQIVEDPFVPTHAETICFDATNSYFFKNGSITSVDINSLFIKPEPPQVFYKILKTNDKTYTIQDEMELSFSESRNISLSFSSLSPYSKNIVFQYSVSKNNDDNWREVKGDINLVHPDFGDYVIKLRAKSISSNFSKPIFFTLHIARPFWLSWWFILLVLIIVLSVIIIVFRYKILYELRKKEKAHDAEIKFMKSEYTALNALMNPHFIFNTLNNVQDLVNRGDKFTANEYLKIFANLIRQNMHNISKEQISLQREIDLVANYLMLEKLRFDEYLNYSIEVDEDIDLTEIMVPPLLIQPLVENSIKHGILPMQSDKGFICIKVFEKNGYAFIEVRDNGVGVNKIRINASGQYESYGLNNIKKRIEQLSIIQNKSIAFNICDINQDGHANTGTIVTISIPL